MSSDGAADTGWPWRLALVGLVLVLVAGIPGIRRGVRLAELYGSAAGIDVRDHTDQVLVLRPTAGAPLDDLAVRYADHPAVAAVRLPKLPDDLARELSPEERALAERTLRGGDGWQTLLLEVRADRGDLVPALYAEPDVRLVGAPITEHGYARAAFAELARITPPVFAVFALCLTAVFRSLGGVVLPLAASATNGAVILGIVGWSGASLTGANTLLVPLVVVLGLADSVHLVRRLAERPRLADAVRDVAPACLLTSLTTALGFAVLAATSQPMLQEFGRLAATGMAVAWVVSLGVPAALVKTWPALRPPPRELADLPTPPAGARPALALLLVGALALTTQVQTGLRPLGSLPDPHPVRDAQALVDTELGGSHPLTLTLPGEAPLSEDVAAWDALVALRESLGRDPTVGAVWSFADVAAWVGRAMGRPPQLLAGPPHAPERARVRKLVTMHARTQALAERLSPVPLATDDSYQLTARLRGTDVAAWADTLARAEARGAVASGHVALAVAAWRQVWPDFLAAVGIAGCVTLVGVGLRFRLRVLGIAATTLALAVATPLACMVALGWPLDPPGVVVFTLGIGVGVDGILHLATRLERADDPVRAWQEVARPVVWSQGLTLAGLGTLAAVSTLPILREIAILLAVSTTAGIAAAVSLTAVTADSDSSR
jgi:predicted RND superfamily exporter protein